MTQLPLDLSAEAPQQRRTAAPLRSFHISRPGGHATVPEALGGERRAGRQEDLLLTWFRSDLRPNGRRFTPSEVHSHFGQWPLTSIRRALTNLTTKGLLVHHPTDRRPGPMGAKESTWSLA